MTQVQLSTLLGEGTCRMMAKAIIVGDAVAPQGLLRIQQYVRMT